MREKRLIMAAPENNQLDDLFGQGKVYLDAKLDEIKLRTVQGLSLGISGLLSTLVLVFVLGIALGVFAYAGVQWLNLEVGAPWGTLIVGAAVLLLFACLYAVRKKLFLNSFVRLFIGVFFNDSKKEDGK